MSALELTANSNGVIIGASIDSVAIADLVSAQQSLERGTLRATIVANFDSIEVTEQSTPTITGTFAAGTVSNSTKVTSVTIGAGNHLEYRVSTATVTTPGVGDVISNATPYSLGADIVLPALTYRHLALYELSADYKVVKFVDHTLLDAEINIPIP